MTIFVHRASECLTDHLPHGDGLICHSLLSGLVDRGHRVFAYTNHDGVSRKPPGLEVLAREHLVPANSLAGWEHAWRAEQWWGEITRRERVDVVWRMHPYGTGCPTVPKTAGRPLVIGPLFYSWPDDPTRPVTTGKPRLGIGLRPLIDPIARRGWDRTLRTASLVLCATEPQSAQLRTEISARVETLPVIVDAPIGLPERPTGRIGQVRLVFVANLVGNKRPEVFCQTVKILRDRGVEASATVIGDGIERQVLREWCRAQGMGDEVIQFAGRVPNADVYGRVAQADLLVSTSFGEPYGRGIAEAMSVGTPAVCHRSGGPADFIADGVDGALVNDLEPASYAGRIAKLVFDERLPDLARAASTKAAAWTSSVVLARLERLLTEATATRPPSNR